MASDAFRKAGLNIGPDALGEFLEKTGTDTRQIVQEVEKLSVYLGDRKNVQVADVHAIVSPSREAVMPIQSGDTSAALSMTLPITCRSAGSAGAA